MNLDLTDGAAAVQLDLSDYPDSGKAGQVLLLQNLGPGDVYFDRFDDVDDATGVKIAANGNYEMSIEGSADLYVMASGDDADLRFSVVG